MARTTQISHIQYYVKENFHSEYQGSLRRLESSIEEEYFNNIRQACVREKNYSMYRITPFFFLFFSIYPTYFFKYYNNYNFFSVSFSLKDLKEVLNFIFFLEEAMIWKARNFGDHDLYMKAKNLEMPSCKKVQEMQDRF